MQLGMGTLVVGMGWDGNGKEVIEMGRNGNRNTVSAHLYSTFKLISSCPDWQCDCPRSHVLLRRHMGLSTVVVDNFVGSCKNLTVQTWC